MLSQVPHAVWNCACGRRVSACGRQEQKRVGTCSGCTSTTSHVRCSFADGEEDGSGGICPFIEDSCRRLPQVQTVFVLGHRTPAVEGQARRPDSGDANKSHEQTRDRGLVLIARSDAFGHRLRPHTSASTFSPSCSRIPAVLLKCLPYAPLVGHVAARSSRYCVVHGVVAVGSIDRFTIVD